MFSGNAIGDQGGSGLQMAAPCHWEMQLPIARPLGAL